MSVNNNCWLLRRSYIPQKYVTVGKCTSTNANSCTCTNIYLVLAAVGTVGDCWQLDLPHTTYIFPKTEMRKNLRNCIIEKC